MVNDDRPDHGSCSSRRNENVGNIPGSTDRMRSEVKGLPGYIAPKEFAAAGKAVQFSHWNILIGRSCAQRCSDQNLAIREIGIVRGEVRGLIEMLGRMVVGSSFQPPCYL